MQKGIKTKQEAGAIEELRKGNLEAQKINLNKIKQDLIGAQLDNKYKNESLKDRLQEVAMKALHAKATLNGQNLTNQLRQLQINLKKEGVDEPPRNSGRCNLASSDITPK